MIANDGLHHLIFASCFEVQFKAFLLPLLPVTSTGISMKSFAVVYSVPLSGTLVNLDYVRHLFRTNKTWC